MAKLSAILLASLLLASVLLAWVPARWPETVLDCGVFALVLLWALRMAIRPYPLATSAAMAPLAAMVLWGLLQLALGRSVYRWQTWNAVLAWGASLAIFSLALQLFAQTAIRERFLRALLLFGFILSVAATLQLYSAGGRVFWIIPARENDSVVGPFVYKNQYAAFIEMVLPLALYAAVRPSAARFRYVLMAAAMYASVIAADSRAGFALATAEVLAVVVLAWRRHLRAVLVTLIAATLVFTSAIGWQPLWHRFQVGFVDQPRREFLISSLEMIRERPWMGFGLGTWSTAYPAFARFDSGAFANQAHNDWVQWTAEGGLPALLFLLALALWSVRPAWRSGWGLGVVCIFVHSLVDYPLQRPCLAALFAVLLAAVASHRTGVEKNA